jgi:hypothetical protein
LSASGLTEQHNRIAGDRSVTVIPARVGHVMMPKIGRPEFVKKALLAGCWPVAGTL